LYDWSGVSYLTKAYAMSFWIIMFASP
jgi:hypothetical protein